MERKIDQFISSERTPAAFREAALKELQAGQFANAQSYCQQALALEPEGSETLHLLALAHLGAGQFDHAIECASRAIRNEPRPAYLTTLGTALLKKGWGPEALQAFEKAVALKPDDPELWVKFGDALQEMKRPADALRAFQRALEIDPPNLKATYKSGDLLWESGQFEEALACFDRCLEIRPDDVQSLHVRACTLKDLGRLEECLADNMRAHQLDPENPRHCNNVGDALLWLGRRDEAGEWFDKALALQPDNVDALANKAVWFREGHQLAEAADFYERLRKTHPLEARFEFGLGLVHLQMGNFEAGWRHREARWKIPGLSAVPPNYSQPIWRGDADLTGKTILIYSEEGLGDAIQFARYVPMVAARGANVVLLVQHASLPLMSGIAGVRECHSFTSSDSFTSQVARLTFDMSCALGSLPLVFGTSLETIPPAKYLPPVSEGRAQAWEDRLGPHDRLRVGLVWSGNPKQQNDRNRSMSLQTMARLLDVDATFVSLQKDPRPEDKIVLSERKDIVDLTAHLTDFAETAALISRLDVVVTVCTSVAHLAATLGRPTWVLLSYTPHWCWLLDRNDSPWYPTARLFRQTETREYESVLDRVRTELMALGGRKIDQFVPSRRTPAALRETALKELQAGQFANAQSCCEQALALEPESLETLHLLVGVHLSAGQFDDAVETALLAIRNEPRPAYLTSLGAELLKLGRGTEALQAFDKAVALKPDDPEVWVKFGNALQELKRPADAFRTFQRALEIDPSNLEATLKSGIILRETPGRLEEALARFDRCLEIRPDDVRSLHFRAWTLKDLGRLEECLADNMLAHRLDPRDPVHCNNVGDAQLWLGRWDEAGGWFDQALALQPDDIDALGHKARWFHQTHRLAEAADIYERLTRMRPLEARFEFGLGLVHLQMGNFEAGWRHREARFKVPEYSIAHPDSSQPMWRGDADLSGKTILIYSEEALGDAIQFARYVPMVAARGASVVLAVQEALLPLMSGMAGVRECRCRSFTSSGSVSSLAVPPTIDMSCALGSLPLAFGTSLETIPPAEYLPPVSEERAQAWEERLGPHDRLRVGLVWSGNVKHLNDRNRSVPLQTMTRLLDIDATFVSLQKDPRPDDKIALSGRKDIVDLTAHLTDFAETAALISRLDVMVTVDTSVAHLAATLGRPTWILLPYTPDWRWLLDGDDSPWYPTARLFRQTETREYESVLDRVRTELMALAMAGRPSAATNR